MAFSIKSDEADRLVRELTQLTGETLTGAVTESVRERLLRERLRAGGTKRERLREFRRMIAALPPANDPGDEEIMGWDAIGLPT